MILSTKWNEFQDSQYLRCSNLFNVKWNWTVKCWICLQRIICTTTLTHIDIQHGLNIFLFLRTIYRTILHHYLFSIAFILRNKWSNILQNNSITMQSKFNWKRHGTNDVKISINWQSSFKKLNIWRRSKVKGIIQIKSFFKEIKSMKFTHSVQMWTISENGNYFSLGFCVVFIFHMYTKYISMVQI